ncbi:MAG: glycosyl hydrolase, partial [Fimbriimonas sp.]
MPAFRFPLLLLTALAFGLVSAQVREEEEEERGAAPDQVSKTQEQKLYHSEPAKGMPAATRMAGWEQRKRLLGESVFGNLLWRNVGPEVQSGRVVDIIAPRDKPDDVLVAFATGGLWRTSDDGITWKPLFDQESTFGIGDVAVSHDGNTIYIGSGEANSQRTSYAGTGVFKSIDAGKTWTNVGLPESHHIGRVVIDPKNENIVWVGALGHLYSPNEERGVYRSADGGKTWDHVLKVDENTGCVDLAVDPKNPSTAYAAMYDRERRAWNYRESGKGSGVYKTTNGGKTWQKVTALPSGDVAGRYGLSISASNPNVIIATLDNQGDDPEWDGLDEYVASGTLTPRRFLRLDEKTFASLDKSVLEPFWRSYGPSGTSLDDVVKQVAEGKLKLEDVRKKIETRNPAAFTPPLIQDEIYRSEDGGKTWNRMRLGEVGGGYTYYFGKCWINPRDDKDIVVGGFIMVRSRDGGKTWRQMANRVHVDFHGFWFDPRNATKMWVGNDGGPYLSGDDGATWRHLNNLSVGQTTTVAVDNKSPYNIFTGLQDNGTLKGPSTYVPGLSDKSLWQAVGGGDGSAIAVDPRDNGDIYFSSSQFGALSGRNQKTNERWSARPAGPSLRYNWITPIVISAFHPDIVYVGSQYLHRSFNGGRRFEPISGDLTKNKPNGDVPFSTIKDLSESPLKFGLIYTGADDGSVKVTPDGGFQWLDIPTPAPNKWVSRVVASKFDVGTVYVAQNGYREDDFAAYLWKSTDQGKTWTSIVGNLPAEPINVVREDPDNQDVLYVGTDAGVYVTFDGGKKWESLHGGMPTAPIHDLVIQPRERDLIAASHSRGIWILPLKQVFAVTPELRAADLTIL